MLPDLYRHSYAALQHKLEQLQVAVTAANPDLKVLQTTFQATQSQFQQQILPLDLDAIDPALALKLQSIQTEISKQLRLLSIDFGFLQTARQSATVQHRFAQIGDRLSILHRYCEMVLGDGE